MPYHVGAKGSNDCSGFPVVDDKGKVHGCHPTKAHANRQVQALYAAGAVEKGMNLFTTNLIKVDSIQDTGPDMEEPSSTYQGCGCATCKELNCDCPECPVCGEDMSKSQCCPDEVSKQNPCWDGYIQRGMKPGKNGKMVPNCIPVEKALDLWEDSDDVVYETDSVSKADGYSPPEGARSAARKAIKFKEEGKANGAGTAVGWTRAGQLARGETLSLSTVKRMYSYFSRHEVDKKGKDWGNSANPSNGYIMWLAWGGDAGFSWSRSIVEREKNKTEKLWSGSAFDLNK